MGTRRWSRRLAASGLWAVAWSAVALAEDGVSISGAPPVETAGAIDEQRHDPALAVGESAHAACPAPMPTLAMSRDQEVAELYRQFECRFLEQRYADGLPYLERACTLKSSPRCLLNLAAVHHGLMHCELARAYYFRYLDVVPYDEASEPAQQALAELDSSCGTPATPGSPRALDASKEPLPVAAANGPLAAASNGTRSPDASKEPLPAIPALPADAARPSAMAATRPERQRPHSRASLPGAAVPVGPLEARRPSIEHQVGLWLMGAGAASGAAALVAVAYGARVERDAERRDHLNGPLGVADDPELYAIDRAGRRSNQFAAGLGIGSGLLIGAGLTLWLASPSSGASVELDPDGAATLGYHRAF